MRAAGRARSGRADRARTQRLEDRATDTRERDYALRLRRGGGARWKRRLDVQAPYRRHLRGLRRIATDAGFEVEKTDSFPAPRFAGRFFRHHEFVLVARKPR